MPPILDAAIGTFFVFMLFSIAVTALNEVVLSFLDKRADFLRLGLGELLSDPQRHCMEGFVKKLAKYSANSNAWVAFWTVAAFLMVVTTNQRWEAVFTGVAVAALLLGTRLALKLWDKPAAPTTSPITVEALFDHPLIFSLSKGESDPSYIGSGSFAKALIDLLVPTLTTSAAGVATVSTTPPTLAEIQTAVQGLPTTTAKQRKLQQTLAALLREADQDVAKFQTAIEGWFNNSMDRVTGWYKRHAQTWLIFLAFILAVVGNVDAIRITQTLANSPNLAKAVTAQAEKYVKDNPALTEPAEVSAALQKKKDALTAAEQNLAKLTQPLVDAKEKLANATDEAAKNTATAELDKTVAAMDPKALAAAQQALKNAQLDISLPLSVAALHAIRTAKDDNIQKARAALFEAQQTHDAKKINDAEQKLNEAIGFDAAMVQFTNDLNALSATGLPMGWDDETHQRFGIMPNSPKTNLPQPLWNNTLGKWISRPYIWLVAHFHRPQHWNWNILFPALCGWGLTAIAASLGAPFWFDLLQRIMNLRANGRSPDEKALGTKKGT